MSFYSHQFTQEQFGALVDLIAVLLQPNVIRIRWNPAYDHDGEEMLFFRIVVSDGTDSDTCQNARFTLEALRSIGEIKFPILVNFRDLSEAVAMKDAEWD